jgi:2-(1,2-epoxy-1,2-dihydrophenyl)acetyl-CoA isomerase
MGDLGLDVEITEGVAWLRFNRPEKRNACDFPTRKFLLETIARIRTDPTVRAAVITGRGDAFCAGADLKDLTGDMDVERENVAGDGSTIHWAHIFEAIWSNEKPFLAAVNGPAAGFGCNLAFACDLIVASERAQFIEAFVRRGLPLEAGAAYILPRMTSVHRAKQMALFGDPVSGADAERWNLVNICVPHDAFEATVRDWAARLASGPTIRMGQIKQQINNSLDSHREHTFRQEVWLLQAGGGDDSREAMTAWREKREPKFTGH